MLIAVSGNIGSGKTTLAKYLSKHYNFHYVPHRRLEFDFIDEFFHDVEGKFFPAQISFLISKAIEIQEHLAYKHNIIMDRCLLEDIDVFARLWIENRQIDPKIVQLYHHTANFIKTAVPVPDLYIVCRCPANISYTRIAQRPQRSFEKEYPPNYVQMLEEYYSQLTFEAEVPYVEIDTTYYDFTEPAVLDCISTQLLERLENRVSYNQLSLFEDNPRDTLRIPGMVFHNFSNITQIISFQRTKHTAKYIYLAAPFTQFATQTESTIDEQNYADTLFDGLYNDVPYGELPSRYRNSLKRIEKAIKKHCDIPVFLPHRDINHWGKTPFSTEQITPKLVESVEKASALIA